MKKIAELTLALALLTVASMVLVSATPAGASKQRVVIEAKKVAGPGVGTFALTPQGSGPLAADSGTFGATVSQRTIVRSGQSVTIFTATSTWTGKKGTLLLRERVEDVAAGGIYRVGTGVWSLLSAKGSGQYAGVSGSGRSAYVATPKAAVDRVSFRYEGLVGK